MPLADPRPILAAARSARHGVGAFNTTLLEHAEALIAGAEREIKKNGAQSMGQLATMSASEWNAPVAAPHTK